MHRKENENEIQAMLPLDELLGNVQNSNRRITFTLHLFYLSVNVSYRICIVFLYN